MGRPSKDKQEPVVTTDPVLTDTEKEQTEPVVPLRNLHTVSVSFEQKETIIKNESDVNFEYNYPSDFKGKKWFKDGHVSIISKESADLFVKQGIGKIIK